MPVNSVHTTSFLYRFLLSTEYKFRAARYISLIIVMAIISLNITIFSYRGNIHLVGNHLYGIWFLLFLCYLSAIFFNLYILIPNFLLKKKYGTYTCFLSLAVLFMVGIQIALEYFSYQYWNLPENRNSYCSWVTLFDIVSSFVMDIICLVGGSMPIVFRHWTIENQHIHEIKQKHLKTEVNSLKEQVNPHLLLNVLYTSGLLATSDPTRASTLLMKLSQILRYQLYDCNWNYVSLNSEIHFLRNYLELRKLCSENLQYTLNISGNITMTIVPPLLFIPFIHYVSEENRTRQIYIEFKTTEDTIHFVCRYTPLEVAPKSEFQQIRQRLTLLYKDHFQLSTKIPGIIQLHLKTNYDNFILY